MLKTKVLRTGGVAGTSPSASTIELMHLPAQMANDAYGTVLDRLYYVLASALHPQFVPATAVRFDVAWKPIIAAPAGTFGSRQDEVNIVGACDTLKCREMPRRR